MVMYMDIYFPQSNFPLKFLITSIVFLLTEFHVLCFRMSFEQMQTQGFVLLLWCQSMAIMGRKCLLENLTHGLELC